MMKVRSRRLWLLGCLVLFSVGAACTGSNNGGAGGDQERTACDPTTTPVVFAHGALEVGDAFANQAMRFASNGYCPDRIFAFDWNTVGFTGIDDEVVRLGAFIDQVLAETGADQVDLIGHSMGTSLSHAFLNKDTANAAKVAHYAGLAGRSAQEPPGGVPTITVSSRDDLIVGLSEINGAENFQPEGLDHLQVATSPVTFRYLYRFFNEGEEPRTDRMVPNGRLTLSGRLLTFAENQFSPGLQLDIYPVDPLTGERLQADPAATFVSGEGGVWGPFQAQPGRHYEYVVTDADPFWKPIHYYREPLPRSCNLVYFRTFPPRASLFGFVFGLLINRDPEAMVLATLNINRAIIHGRDELFVDDREVSIPEVTDAGKTAIAIFYTDFPAVEQGEAAAFNDFMVFIQGFDLVVDTQLPDTVPIVFNGRPLSVRNLKSGTDGITIGVFE